MKKSIRFRLFIGLSLIIVFFVALALVLNTFYLQDFYRSQKTSFLMNAAQEIDQAYGGTPASLAGKLESLERNSGLSIIIVSQDYHLKYSSRSLLDKVSRKDYFLILLIQQRGPELLQQGSLLVVTKDPDLQTDFLSLVYRLNNQDNLILSTPLLAIEENAAIANRFFLYTGLITLLIGGLLAFILSRQFTRPILELKDIARNMATLDFSKKYRGSSNDEFGELGQSINSLSDQLSKSISELQEANSKLQEDIARERKIDKMRKEFISSVSHELKTPIALIQGYAEGLKVEVNDAQEDKDFYCDVIIDEIGKMNKLVRDLLDLSQIESGYFPLEKRNINFRSYLDELVVKYEPLFKGKGILPQLVSPDSITVNADPVRCEQVLINYLNNAINYCDERKLIMIKASTRDDKVRVSVFNSGPPIPEEALDKVFTSFYKVDRARTRSYGGTGIGLSVVKAIQELDGNRFGVQNLADGVEFWFELDRVRE